MLAPRRRQYRVALVGAFGCGNFGNDATLDAAMEALRDTVGPAEILCVCTEPEQIIDRFGVDATHLHGRPTQRGWSSSSSRIVRAVVRIPMLCSRALSAFRQARTVETFVVAGTGALDDQHTGPGGQPLDMALWCIAARAARARVVIIGVGAGPIDSRYSKLLIRAAARAAHEVSYRDTLSRDYMQGVGRNVSRDDVVADLVFGLQAPPIDRPRSSAPSVAIGVLFSGNWGDRLDAAAAYRARLLDVVSRLWATGHRVVLIPGDDVDFDSCIEVADQLRAMGGAPTPGHLEIPHVTSFADVSSVLARCDAAIVSRYHNLVAALMTSCPVVSLEYGFKNRAVMRSMGLEDRCLHIDEFDPAHVVDLVDDRCEQSMDRVVGVVDEFRARLADEWTKVLSVGGVEPSAPHAVGSAQ